MHLFEMNAYKHSGERRVVYFEEKRTYLREGRTKVLVATNISERYVLNP
jgi:hypothetical protein